jgi:ABC-type multidrug transport system fused ATPase/permease subunit
VLDEPTAHLDTDSAAVIGETIGRLARGRTTLLIVHHPSLAERAERSVRIAGGKLIGEPARLELAA